MVCLFILFTFMWFFFFLLYRHPIIVLISTSFHREQFTSLSFCTCLFHLISPSWQYFQVEHFKTRLNIFWKVLISPVRFSFHYCIKILYYTFWFSFIIELSSCFKFGSFFFQHKKIFLSLPFRVFFHFFNFFFLSVTYRHELNFHITLCCAVSTFFLHFAICSCHDCWCC